LFQIYSINATVGGFGSNFRNVNQVLAINITTGWQDFTPLKEKVLKDLTIKFPLLSQNIFQPSSLFEAILYPNCNLGNCHYVGNFPITLSSENKRDYLGIYWTLNFVISELFMNATLWDEDKSSPINGTLFTKYEKEGESLAKFKLVYCHSLQFESILREANYLLFYT